MPITRKTTDSLIEAQINTSAEGGNAADESAETEKNSKDQAKPKKRGFFASTIYELKKVEWPGKDYVITWSIAVIIFTAVFAVAVGSVDHVYSGLIKFVDCTSIQGENNLFNKNDQGNITSVKDKCFKDLPSNIFNAKR